MRALRARADVPEPQAVRLSLAARLTAGSLPTEPVDIRKWTGQAGWAKIIRRLGAALSDEEPMAVAAFRIRRRG